MYQMTDEEFEQAVEEALENLPDRFTAALDNVAIVIEDEPADDQDTRADGEAGGGEVLGFYDGIPLTERDGYYDFVVPDLIYIFKGPHERSFGSRERIVEEIGKTVAHEIGHYFGLDDAELRRLGL